MLTKFNAYRNSRPDVDWNTCGQAAIASILDYHHLDPWNLARTHGRWNDGAAIDAVKADGFGPDIIFGWGSSAGLIAKALRHYGLAARPRGLAFDGGWEHAWPELLNMLDRELPVPVMLDLGRLNGSHNQFHWAIAYGYDSNSLHLAAVTPSRPSHQIFRDAWRCDFVFIPTDLKFSSVLPLRPAGGGRAQSDRLSAGERLGPDESITSTDGRFTLRYQTDGNLVLYRNTDGRALWDTRPRGLAGHVIMQSDGNLVMYDSRVVPAVWDSGTYESPGAFLRVQNDGNVVIWRAGGTQAWATNTAETPVPVGPQAVGNDILPGEIMAPGTSIISVDGRFALTYGSDGNLVLHRIKDGASMWASDTAGTAPGVTTMQPDGNLVVYDAFATAVWASGTSGQDGNKVIVQNDGNVVVYRPDGSASWATNTYNWAAAPHNVVHTPDGDVIETTVEHGAVGADVVEFVLQLDGNVTWRKIVNMPDGEGSNWDIVAEGHGGSGSNSLWAHQVNNGQRLTLSKAKFAGVMVPVYSLGGLQDLAGGDRVTFRWVKD